MLTDGPYNIVKESSEGRKIEFPLHLPQYISCERPESLVQGEVGGRIEKRQRRKTSGMWTVQGKIIRKGLPEVQAFRKSFTKDPKDFWCDVEWSKTVSNKKKKKQKAGDWWEADDC